MNYTVINISSNCKQVFFGKTFIGELHMSDTQNGWYVKPNFADYTGFFRSLDVAEAELVGQYCIENNLIC